MSLTAQPLPEGLLELPASLQLSSPPGSLPGADRTRGRRRALLRREEAEAAPEQPVLLEWFSGPDAPARVARGRLRRALQHGHLLRLLRIGCAEVDGTFRGFAISEAPAGVDLATLQRAARAAGTPLPPWWSAAVLHAAGRGLLALHRHLLALDAAPCHGALAPAALFVGWQGEVQLLGFSADPGALLAPEARALQRIAGAPADVYAFARLIEELLPEEERRRPELAGLLAAARAPDPERRPPLPALLLGLRRYLLTVPAPLQRAQAIGALVAQTCPRDAVELGLEEAQEPDGPAASVSAPPVNAAVSIDANANVNRAAPPPGPRASLGRVGALLYAGALVLLLLGLYFGMRSLRAPHADYPDAPVSLRPL